jgi:hypothetical protein
MNESKSVYMLENPRIVNHKSGKSIMIATYKIKKEKPANSQWVEYTVRLSHKLRTWIENDWKRSNTKGISTRKREPYLRFGQVYVGCRFISANTSRVLQDCPYRLDKYTPEPGCDMPINYKLSFVDEGNTFSEVAVDEFDREELILNYRGLSRKKFRRVVRHNVNTMMAQLPEDFRIGIELATKTS